MAKVGPIGFHWIQGYGTANWDTCTSIAYDINLDVVYVTGDYGGNLQVS